MIEKMIGSKGEEQESKDDTQINDGDENRTRIQLKKMHVVCLQILECL